MHTCMYSGPRDTLVSWLYLEDVGLVPHSLFDLDGQGLPRVSFQHEDRPAVDASGPIDYQADDGGKEDTWCA